MSDDDWIAALLRRARTTLNMDMAWVASHRDGQTMQVEHIDGALDGALADSAVAKGSRLSYEATFCSRVIGDGPAAAVPDLSRDERTRDLPVRTELGIASYVGAPIRYSDGSAYGMLCCFSSQINSDLAQREAQILALIAGIIGDHLDASLARDADRRDTIRRIETLIDSGGPGIVFQAVFNVPSMTVRGWEALSRFPAGWGAPDRWFADAASVGLGVELEMAAITNALIQSRELPPGAFVGINASPATLCHPDFLHSLTHTDPASLIIEITEHSPVEDYCELLSAVSAIRALGIPVAVDDAGAGYAGLRHLVELRPSGIKLDRALISNLDTDPARRAIVSAMLSFASDIGARVLGEGVETIEELQTLARLGVRIAQGYLLHRPQPAALATHASAPQMVHALLAPRAHIA